MQIEISYRRDDGTAGFSLVKNDWETFAQCLSDYSPFGPNHGTYAQCDGSEIHPWGLLSYSPCMSLAETCIVLEHCPEAKPHDDDSWLHDLNTLTTTYQRQFPPYL